MHDDVCFSVSVTSVSVSQIHENMFLYLVWTIERYWFIPGEKKNKIRSVSSENLSFRGNPCVHLCLYTLLPLTHREKGGEKRQGEKKTRKKCSEKKYAHLCLSSVNVFQIAGLCCTFRNGMTKGRRGKLVASCSLEWNSSMVNVEFWKKERTSECIWKTLCDNTAHWRQR